MIALLSLLAACFGGALLAATLDKEAKRLNETLALGSAFGLALFAGFGFVLGWLRGLSATIVALASALVVVCGVVFGAQPSSLLRRKPMRPSNGMILLGIFTFAFIGRLADRTLFETPNGLAIADRHNFGDLPFHMGIAAGFAYGNNFPPMHPELAGVPLTYPFFGDVVSGMILAAGGSWRDAFLWPTLILGLSVVVAVVRFGEAVTKSRVLGRVSAAMTFFSGGLGFLQLTSAAEISKWWTTGPDVTIADTGLRYANFVTTLFIPQRSILFGWPLLFFALALLVESLEPENTSLRDRKWRHAGIIASVLPLVHAHSFAVLCFCAAALAAITRFRSIVALIKGILPLALPSLLFMVAHNSLATQSFFAWSPGFDSGGPWPFAFWLKNAGLFLPLAIAGLAVARSRAIRASIGLPFVALFIGANLFRLSPWIWDNMKFLAPAHAGLAPFAALTLSLAWNRSALGKGLATTAFIATILSGALDVSKVAFAGGSFQIYDNVDLAFANKVRETTAPDATILTAPTHNHPVLLSGRRLFLGYEGHLWSQGMTYTDRKPIAAAMFQGANQSPTDGQPVRIRYITITPAEASLIDAAALEGLPSIVDSPYRLLRVR